MKKSLTFLLTLTLAFSLCYTNLSASNHYTNFKKPNLIELEETPSPRGLGTVVWLYLKSKVVAKVIEGVVEAVAGVNVDDFIDIAIDFIGDGPYYDYEKVFLIWDDAIQTYEVVRYISWSGNECTRPNSNTSWVCKYSLDV